MKYLLDTHVLLWALKGVNGVSNLVKEHKDPYDWLLVSQAKCEKMKLITHDSKFKHYLEECIISF